MANQSGVRRWQDMIGAQSLDDYISEHYGDRAQFRIRRDRYAPGTTYAGLGIGSLCFTVSGKGRWVFEAAQFVLEAGQCCSLPEGQYGFEALGNETYAGVRVFEIPARGT